MTELFTGVPGSGKSLHAAERIYKHLSRGGKVIANFDIDQSVIKSKRRGEFIYMDNLALNPERLKRQSVETHRRKKDRQGRERMIEGQTLLVLDECQILFNSRCWNAKERMGWCIFFTQHRKYGYDILLIAPFERMIDRQIRAVVEFEVVHRVVSNFKSLGFVLGLLSGGKLFVSIRIWNGTKQKESSRFFKLKRRYMHLYDSYRIFADTEDGVPQAGSPRPEPGKCGTEISDAKPRPKEEAIEPELLSAPDGLSWDKTEAESAVV
jgi:hypothetical protein